MRPASGVDLPTYRSLHCARPTPRQFVRVYVLGPRGYAAGHWRRAGYFHRAHKPRGRGSTFENAVCPEVTRQSTTGITAVVHPRLFDPVLACLSGCILDAARIIFKRRVAQL